MVFFANHQGETAVFGELKMRGGFHLDIRRQAGDMNDGRNRTVGTSRRLQGQTVAETFTEIATVGHLPADAGDALLDEGLGVGVGRLFGHDGEEFLTDRMRIKAAGLNFQRLGRLQHGAVGGGGGTEEEASEGQEGQDGFHGCGCLNALFIGRFGCWVDFACDCANDSPVL